MDGRRYKVNALRIRYGGRGVASEIETSFEFQVSDLVNSDTCPRPTARGIESLSEYGIQVDERECSAAVRPKLVIYMRVKICV